MDNLAVDSELSLADYFSRAAATAREVFASYPVGALDEQAGPAYLKGFALSRWIFWRRLSKVIRRLPREGSRCLDFGCGFGMMLPVLDRRFDAVYAVDLMPDLAREFLRKWHDREKPLRHPIAIETAIERHQLADHSLDLILALDVLEHVDDLPGLLQTMARLLKSSGTLLVTGPTENWVYKLGRWAVGFSGEYHVRNIHDIRAEMEKCLEVKLVGRVFFPLTLFHILEGQPTPRHV